MAYELRSARFLAAEVRERVIMPGDTVVDATVGNGYDTCHLAALVGETGHVIGFDIQQEAVARAQARLCEQNLDLRCTLHAVGHQLMSEYVPQGVSCIVFNLGWLPGGDKSITTLWKTTEQAIHAALSLLKKGGVCTVCVYPGHEAGDIERANLIEMLSQLRPQEYNVLRQAFLNAGTGSPECYVIQKQ